MNLLKRSSFKGITVLAAISAMLVLTMGYRPGVVLAHPLGNFTINHYSRVELAADAVRLRYILDMAEIPAFQEMSEIDLNKDGLLSWTLYIRRHNTRCR
ncbi:MAG TPA: hypothetical protein VFR55_03065 [Dehalococcoidia bacterium]|nr:hypothetical protein [Dehalococcoidia bacterium]